MNVVAQTIIGSNLAKLTDRLQNVLQNDISANNLLQTGDKILMVVLVHL